MAKEVKAEEPDFSMSDVLGMLSEQKDAREKAFSEMAQKLFSREDLLMIARLDDNLAFYILRLQVIYHMYQEYWNRISVDYELKETPQGWTCEVQEHAEKLPKHMAAAYKSVVEDILQITISFKGQGRKEILETMMSAEAKLVQEEMRKNRGIMGKFIN
jgi:hypothetical protein